MIKRMRGSAIPLKLKILQFKRCKIPDRQLQVKSMISYARIETGMGTDSA